jgi:hypothetical protein
LNVQHFAASDHLLLSDDDVFRSVDSVPARGVELAGYFSLGTTVRPPRETEPSNVPPGTAQLSGPTDWFALALVVRGPNVEPDEISNLLGLTPTRAIQKGERVAPGNPRSRISDVGIWELAIDPATASQADVVDAAERLMVIARATPTAWRSIPTGSDVYLDVGISLTAASGAIWLPPSLMQALAERDIEARFDLYERTVPRGP